MPALNFKLDHFSKYKEIKKKKKVKCVTDGFMRFYKSDLFKVLREEEEDGEAEDENNKIYDEVVHMLRSTSRWTKWESMFDSSVLYKKASF